MTCYQYVRESTWDQVDGLDVQLEQTRAYCAEKLPDIPVGRSFTDRAVSGGKPFARRAGGKQLDSLLARGDHVVVSKLDRGFRDTLDFLATERDWRDRGVTLHVLDLPFLSAEVPEYIASMIRTVLAMFAQFERARIRQRTKDVMRYLKAKGRRHNQYAGMGFEWVRVGSGFERRAHAGEQAAMQLICSRRAAGATWHAIYLELIHERTKDGKKWSVSRIQRAARAWNTSQAETA